MKHTIAILVEDQPGVMVLCFVGAYSLHNNVMDIWIMLFFGVLGFVLKRIGFSPVPIVLGLVLGELIETSLRQAMVIHDNNFLIFFTRPYSIVFIIFSILSLSWPLIQNALERSKEKASYLE